MLNDDEVEIVINLTLPQFHVELNKQIITADKHLFSEKPFAPNLKDAKEVLDLADAKGSDTRHIYVGPEAGTDIEVEIPTHYSSILRLKSGVVVNFNVSFDIYRSNLPMFEIYGDGGTLTYLDPNFGGGTPSVYRKEQYTNTVYQKTDEAMTRKDRFL